MTPRAALRIASLLVLALVGAAAAQTAPPASAAASAPSVALFYGADPPWDELAAFDIAVVEAAYAPSPPRLAGDKTAVFAYVALGEMQPSRPYFPDVPAAWRLGTNPDWGSTIIDQAAPEWPRFWIERVVRPLWNAGYRGFLIDTLDSYHAVAKSDAERRAQEAGMVRALRALKTEFPEARLLFNRGFEILPELHRDVTAVVAESIYRGWDPATKGYREVPAADREYLLGQLATVRDTYRLPIVAVDYVAPGDRPLARATADRIRALGFVPWVADRTLTMLGVGAVEVMPRKVLMLHDSGRDLYALREEYVAQYAAMPLNYLGYVPVYRDVTAGGLPEDTLAGRYAAIVLWLYKETPEYEAGLGPFLARAIADGVKVIVLGTFGFTPGTALDAVFPVASRALADEPARVRITARSPQMGYETAVLTDRRGFFALDARASEVWLRVADDAGHTMDAVAITRWGGVALAPYQLLFLPESRGGRWVVNPIEFFRRALAAPLDLPVPDVTTYVGQRGLIVHIDGDGWASRAEIPIAPSDATRPSAKPAPTAGAAATRTAAREPRPAKPAPAAPRSPPRFPYAAELLVREVLEAYRVPTTLSVIQGETGARGLYAKLAPELEAIARRAFALEHVEAASHSFSHPFSWAQAAVAPEERGYTLAIPDYRFDLAAEIDGSIRYINERLLPPGKSVRMFLWTGDCNPGAEAVARAYAAGVFNMNGGETLATRAEPSLTLVAPLGLPKGRHFQVYAPNQNENLYTNNWRGPFFGYARVIETFEFTERPYRLKPINIYFHTYSAAKRASLDALHRVFRWALAANPHPIRASEYAAAVLDFNRIVVARTPAGWLVRGAGDARTLRVPAAAGAPDLAASRGVAGSIVAGDERYVHVAGGETLLAIAREPTARPQLVRANGRIARHERTAEGVQIDLDAHVALAFELDAASACDVRAGGTLAPPTRTSGTRFTYELPADGPRRATILCRG